MRRISKGQLRFALILTALLVIFCLVTGDYIMAIVFAAVAALGTLWQLRHVDRIASEPDDPPRGAENDEERPTS